MSQRITLQHIAAHLRMSHATVSRALSDHPQISEVTKSRVRETAERMGYVVNGSARALRGERSTLVGLVIPDVQNTFFAHVAKIAADALAARGFRLVLCVTEDDSERERRDVKALVEAGVAGIVMVPSVSPAEDTFRLVGKTNVVQLLRFHRRIASDVVRIDDRDATRQSTQHLIDLGHRKIAYIGNPSAPNTGSDRLQGFSEACADAGLQVYPTWVRLGPARPGFGREAIAAIMKPRNRPTGVVTGGVEQVLGILQWMHDERVDCPASLSLVGFGDSPWFELVQGGVSTVHLPVAEVASAAVDLLCQRITEQRHPDSPLRAPTVARYSSTLLVRGTSGPRGKWVE